MKKIKNYYSLGEDVDLNNNKEITYELNKTLNDNYRIRIRKPFKIKITYGNSRSKEYAIETLNYLIKNNKLKYGLIEDGPSFKLRGIIEGFYGEPWTHEDRLNVIRFLKKERMNTYMYAPKDDLYHRKKWRVPYPKNEFSLLKELIKEAKNNDIDFYFSISPGNDFNYTKKEDYDALFNKINEVLNEGVCNFNLLLDDIDYSLKDSEKKEFETPGKAHAYISNKLNSYLKEKLKVYSLVMCPTEYWQNYNTPYRQDLKENLDKNIKVFWTGYKVVPEYIPNIDGDNALKYFGHDLVLWENYPVNDMASDLLFMGPIENRGDKLDKTHIGMVSNPMINWSLSIIPLKTIADYMWNPSNYNKEQSYINAIKEFCDNNVEISSSLINFLDNFRHSIISYYSNNKIENYIKDDKLDKLIEYYESILKDIERIKKLKNKRFLEQISPWFIRFEFDLELLILYKKNKLIELEDKLKFIEDLKYTINSNYALRFLKNKGIYTGKVNRKERINNWE